MIAIHRYPCLFRIILGIQGIIGTQVFVQRDTHALIAYDDALSQSADLSIEAWNRNTGNIMPETGNGVVELFVHIVDVRILSLRIAEDGLQRRILVEGEEFLVDVWRINRSQHEYILDQCTGFHGVIGLHLLKGSKIGCGEIHTLQTVITLNLDALLKHIFIIRLEFPLAGRTQKKHHDQEAIFPHYSQKS